MNKYLLAVFSWQSKPVPVEKIQSVIAQRASDWLRFAPNCWAIYTNESERAWGDRLHGLIGEYDSVLVFEINQHAFYGWVTHIPKDWLERRR